jgi:phosphoribosylamine--glycine ligase
MNVLVIGGGGREHAICHGLARSKRLNRLFILPGNAGTESLGTNIPGDPTDIELLLDVARRESIGLVVVGPEDPLAAGVVDAFEQAGLRAFGPCAAAARLEADKAFAKQIMRRAGVPTAETRIFARTEQELLQRFDARGGEPFDPRHTRIPTAYSRARDYIASRDSAMVVKAAGLARGKGAFVCESPADALLVLDRLMLDRELGDAADTVLVEERLVGREVSVMALVDGRTLYFLESAQDHKRLLEGDAGPNTGGMGAFCPAGALDDETRGLIEREIFVPVVDAMLRDGIPYRGVLDAGLMLTAAGPRVLEFNCRFGDPEAQVILPRIRSDLLDLFEAAVEGRLDEATIDWDPRPAVCVVMASGGYPGEYRTGAPIAGLEGEGAGGQGDEGTRGEQDVIVFHAGTRREGDRVVTSGGRVLGVTALGADLAEARRKAYAAVDDIHFEGAQFRRDIALDA